ncbi:hypothetical protein [Acidaminococcus sp. HCP3S3_H5]|uniref:hypothetical protein n=1 Tax=Acidaminococcus sp. HCP3S3_H5 TaxID=3438733 RepID=UPI003F8F4B6B
MDLLKGEKTARRDYFFTNESIIIPERKFNVKQKFHKNIIFSKNRNLPIGQTGAEGPGEERNHEQNLQGHLEQGAERLCGGVRIGQEPWEGQK